MMMKATKYAIYAAIILIAVGALAAVVKIASIPFSTASGIAQKTFNSENVIHNYEWFYNVDANVKARIAQINQTNSILKNVKDQSEINRLNMELAAQQQSCRDLVVKYNANTNKINTSIFKSNSLPESLNINDCNVKG